MQVYELAIISIDYAIAFGVSGRDEYVSMMHANILSR